MIVQALIGLALGVIVPLAPDSGETPLGRQVGAILTELERADAAWPADSVEAVRAAVAGRDVRATHQALAGHVFLEVAVNPEGRVKVGRGPAGARLSQNRPALFLVRVENQSGGRQRLAAQGSYAGGGGNPFALAFRSSGTLAPDLTGVDVEYRLLAVTAREPGRHELTVSVEAGQGTQDLGFRAQTPVLFLVDAAAKK